MGGELTEKPRRLATRGCAAIAVAVGVALAAPGAAAAAATVGQLFAPNSECTNSARLQAGAVSGNSYEVPSDGVITSWKFQANGDPAKGLKLKVGRPGGGTRYTVVGESAAGALTANAVNTRPARISVKKKDYIGVYASSGDCQATTASGFDIYALYSGDPPVGSTSEDWPYNTKRKLPVQAIVEKDADKDGYGDETQDQCPMTPGSCTPGGGPGGGPGGPGSDATAPVITAVNLAKRRFAARRGQGTTFNYTLSEAARVRFRIARKRSGRRVGGTCRRPTRRNRARKPCTRLVSVGSFTRDAQAGPNATRFAGKVGKRRLRPGRYRATLTAVDAAGNRSPRQRVSFRVVRRR